MFETEVSDDGYEQAWRRLLDGEQIRGIAARLDGKVVGIAHYLFHAGVWVSLVSAGGEYARLRRAQSGARQ